MVAMTPPALPMSAAPASVRPGPRTVFGTWQRPVPPAVAGTPAPPAVWLLAVHGGAGVSSLVACGGGVFGDAGRLVPGATIGQSPFVVAVARTNLHGLEQARDLAAQFSAKRCWPYGTQLSGLLTVADAPGRLPRELTQLRKLTTGGYPADWHIEWQPAWRTSSPAAGAAVPPSVRTALSAIAARCGAPNPLQTRTT